MRCARDELVYKYWIIIESADNRSADNRSADNRKSSVYSKSLV